MTGVRRTRKGLVVSFDDVEASLLRHLVGEVRALLAGDGGRAGPSAAGDGPAADFRPAGAVPTDAELAALTGMDDGPVDPAGGAGRPTRTGVDGAAAPDGPVDPALARLLPDAYRDDPAAAGEFRRLTEASLRRDKVAAAERMLATLPPDGPGEVRLDPQTVDTWLSTINDVRLALGTRLEVTEEMPEPDPDDPDAPAYVVYLWLTELQGVLVELAEP